jgi:hypothetical protein
MPTAMERFFELSGHLNNLLDTDPELAVREAREIDLSSPDWPNMMSLRAAILVDGGALTGQPDAIDEGLALYRKLHSQYTTVEVTYNLANALVAAIVHLPQDSSWLDYQEANREYRAQARRLFWKVAHDREAALSLRSQAFTNLANQFSKTYRLGEAHDSRLAALRLDPQNGVAAFCAAQDLFWLFRQGGCSDLTRVEAIMLAKVALLHEQRVAQYAGAQAAERMAAMAKELPDPPARSRHADPFVTWVENERLTLSPAVELVDPTLGKLDWLMLPGILEREAGVGGQPPPLFAMFNILKADFILARDLAWRANDDAGWPNTGRFSDTLDYATYGPGVSALLLAHRTALDLLDKVAVTANHYFELGNAPDKVFFGRIWRGSADKETGERKLHQKVRKLIVKGDYALYGLVELADDYDEKLGILRSYKDLRNSSTHRFVVLHNLGGGSNCRTAPEVEHYDRIRFTEDVLSALRVARSAIQMLALAITQHERILREDGGELIGTLIVPDHDWVRGVDEDEELDEWDEPE